MLLVWGKLLTTLCVCELHVSCHKMPWLVHFPLAMQLFWNTGTYTIKLVWYKTYLRIHTHTHPHLPPTQIFTIFFKNKWWILLDYFSLPPPICFHLLFPFSYLHFRILDLSKRNFLNFRRNHNFIVAVIKKVNVLNRKAFNKT